MARGEETLTCVSRGTMRLEASEENAMDCDDTPLLPHGGYRKLRSYAVAEAIYDVTVVFCRRFLARDRRTCDQMVQRLPRAAASATLAN